MKKVITFLILCLVNLFVIESKATSVVSKDVNPKNQVFQDDPPYILTTIDLIGQLDMNANSNDIIAWLENNTVRISFNRNFGNVSIRLYNSSGLLVHNSVVNTEVQTQVNIPLLGLSSGTYTLVIENNNGWVEGDFEQD